MSFIYLEVSNWIPGSILLLLNVANVTLITQIYDLFPNKFVLVKCNMHIFNLQGYSFSNLKWRCIPFVFMT